MLRGMSLLAVLVGVVLVGVVLTNVAPCQAQSVQFSFGGGHGHGHGHHHHHHHRPAYSFGFFAPPPPPVYVYPRVVAPPVTYVYPYPTAVAAPPPAPAVAATPPAPSAAVADSSAWKTRPQPRTNALPTAQRQMTIIRNPAKSGGAVAFVVDEESEVALDEGQSHSLLQGESYTVEFDRGGDFGTSRKTVSGGVYEFVVTDRGWDLVSQSEVQRTAARTTVKKNSLPATTSR